MAAQSQRLGDVTMMRGGPEAQAKEKPRNHEELGLVLVLFALVAWALYAGLHALDWPAVGHAFKVFLAAIR